MSGLDSSVVSQILAAEREGWDVLRSIQGNQQVDVLRYVQTGGNPVRGIPPTNTLVEGLSDLGVLVGDVTDRVSDSMGIPVETRAGIRAFEFFDDVPIYETDLIRYPAGSGEVFRVIRVLDDLYVPNTIVYARPAPAGEREV